MSQTLDTLVGLLALEPLEDNLFRGASYDLGFPQLFGGQVLGQALSAASQTVEGRQVHSLHGYFLRAGDARLPVVYQVERLRDGGSFSARRISAVQKGQILFSSIASFQNAAEGFEHQASMPAVPDPDDLPSYAELMQQWAAQATEPLRRHLPGRRAIEHRPVGMQNPFKPLQPQEPFQHIWMRAAGRLPDDPALHRYLLAYASDFFLIGTALLPHAASLWQKDIKMASLDHAIWFHREFRADEWLLYSLESPWTGHARGLARGRIFDRQGRLVASVAQEGLIRKREERT
ncbi:acyl-CoA thioesterase II [Azomonas macrocytogenes]|uniref:Acyl-CoA thioesterase 2 n=1 Tax=Azomonas macrocytogenes TaxID=69962 RepID=A0A839T0W9_AZOMA|nr:acyl-CoA thioesterase II [Azomonas macrocytogenes]MBB3102768.1 acyl-CoA thioesterase-2 [Azomonas macrocytogenes]